jgi:hypothetical protein
MISTIEPRVSYPASAEDEREELAVVRNCTLAIIFACLAAMVLLTLAGCSSGNAHAVNPSQARDALVAALDHWKQGDPPRSLSSASPSMTVQDFEWERGAKLLDYQILGDGQSKDANLSVKVKLTLAGEQGKSKTVEKTVSYLVGTSPSVTVFRDMLKR